MDAKLSIIENAEKNKFVVSERVIEELLLKKTPEVRITQISFEENEKGEKNISVRGSASSRERLLVFKRALEEDDLFKNVDLPISNLVKGSNLQFYLTLSPS